MSLRLTRALAAAAIATAALLSVTPSALAEPIGGPQLAGHDVVVDPGPDATPLPDIQASTWILADATTGAVLAAKGPHVARPPASVLKTLSALSLMQHLDPNMVYTATRDDVLVEGSRVGLVDGATYTVRDLFFGLFMQSGNDCASALAHANGGFDVTMGQINEEAQRLQALDTVAVNPSGLPAEGQVTSAYDLALVARAGLSRPDYFEYANTQVIEDYPGYMPEKPGDPRPTIAIATQNPLFIQEYPGAIGLKTGWTTEAGRTFVGAAERDGTRLIVVLMDIQTEIYDSAAPLLDWGFANVNAVTPIGYLADPVKPMADASASAAVTTPSASDAGGDPSASTEASTTPVAASSSTSGGAGSVASSGWAWGLVAAMIVGVVLILLGIRSLRREDGRSAQRRQPVGE